MKLTNRRYDWEVEEFTKRITWESKPLWKRVWINFKKWFYRNQLNFEVVIIYSILLGLGYGFFRFIKNLIDKL